MHLSFCIFTREPQLAASVSDVEATDSTISAGGVAPSPHSTSDERCEHWLGCVDRKSDLIAINKHIHVFFFVFCAGYCGSASTNYSPLFFTIFFSTRCLLLRLSSTPMCLNPPAVIDQNQSGGTARIFCHNIKCRENESRADKKSGLTEKRGRPFTNDRPQAP